MDDKQPSKEALETAARYIFHRPNSTYGEFEVEEFGDVTMHPYLQDAVLSATRKQYALAHALDAFAADAVQREHKQLAASEPNTDKLIAFLNEIERCIYAGSVPENGCRLDRQEARRIVYEYTASVIVATEQRDREWIASRFEIKAAATQKLEDHCWKTGERDKAFKWRRDHRIWTHAALIARGNTIEQPMPEE
jgi:hypothetical protein